VRIDGGAPEQAPASFEVAPGKHRIDVEAASYVPQTLETVAVQGSVVALNVALDPRPGQVLVRAPAGSDVSIDGRPVGPSAVHGPIEVMAGRHLVSVTARGRRPFVRELEVDRGGRVDLSAPLELTTQRWFSYGLFTGAGALAVSTAVVWGLALSRQSDAEALEARLTTGPPLSTAEAARYATLQADRDQFVRIGTATGVIALAAGALGVVLYLVDKPEAPSTIIAPTASPNGAGLTIQGQF
jgi:hypothetical protein